MVDFERLKSVGVRDMHGIVPCPAGALTDDQLRAECERRKMSVSGPGATEETWNSVRAERDDWKRRAEAAEACVGERSRIMPADPDPAVRDYFKSLAKKYSAELAALTERGPGIAATKPDNGVAWLDEDLLCEDA